MEFVGNIVETGAPTFHVTSIGKAELISPNVVKFSYVTANLLPDGTVEHPIEVNLTWDVATLPLLTESFKMALTTLFGAPHEQLKVLPGKHH